MSWASDPTSETSTSPSGQAGHHRRTGPRTFGLVLAAGLLLIAVSGAMLSPVLLGWPPSARDQAISGSSTVATDADPSAAVAASSPTSERISTPSPTPSPAPPPTTARPPAPGGTGIAALENRVFALTNARRAEQGCAALRLDSRLGTAARAHSADMARLGYFDHNSRDGRSPGARMADAGYDISRGWAENIAVGYSNAEAVMKAWMRSTGHRKNILNCDLRALGVGVARANSGLLYWTQDFGGR